MLPYFKHYYFLLMPFTPLSAMYSLSCLLFSLLAAIDSLLATIHSLSCCLFSVFNTTQYCYVSAFDLGYIQEQIRTIINEGIKGSQGGCVILYLHYFKCYKAINKNSKTGNSNLVVMSFLVLWIRTNLQYIQNIVGTFIFRYSTLTIRHSDPARLS